MKVVFFNHYHNGDIHVSRGIIRKIMEKVLHQQPDTTFFYSHRNSPELLLDIPNLIFDPLLINNINQYDNLVKIQDTVYINTWYAQQHNKYLNQYGITFDSLYAALDDTCKKLWNFSLIDISTNISDFFPSIDYSRFKIDTAKIWLNNNLKKKILVENCFAKSYQSINFSIIPTIIELANKHKHKDKIYILSNNEGNNLPENIIYASDVIQKQNNNLNEISFLSTHCDIIIGRASGPFTFSLTQENLFKRNIKYLCFSNLMPRQINKFWLSHLLSDKINYTSNIIVNNDYKNILNFIDCNI